MHVDSPYSREDLLHNYGRPCDNLTCLLLTATWLQQSQSILFGAGNPAIHKYRHDLLQDSAGQCQHMLSCEAHEHGFCEETQSQDTNIPALPNLMRKTTTNCKEVQILLPGTSDGNEMLSSRPRRNMTLQFEVHMVIFQVWFAVLHGALGVQLGPFSPHTETGNSNSIISRSSLATTTLCVYQGNMGKMSVCKRSRWWLFD